MRNNHKPIPIIQDIFKVSFRFIETIRKKFNELKNGNQNIQSRSDMTKIGVCFVEDMGKNTQSHETPKDYSIKENKWFGVVPFISNNY